MGEAGQWAALLASSSSSQPKEQPVFNRSASAPTTRPNAVGSYNGFLGFGTPDAQGAAWNVGERVAQMRSIFSRPSDAKAATEDSPARVVTGSNAGSRPPVADLIRQ